MKRVGNDKLLVYMISRIVGSFDSLKKTTTTIINLFFLLRYFLFCLAEFDIYP